MSEELPEGWATTRVGELFTMSGGGTPPRGEPSFWGGTIPWLSSGDIKTSRITSSSEFITPVGLANSSAKMCEIGTIIVVTRSGILKHTLPVAILDKPAAINQDIRSMDSGSISLNEWLALSLRSHAKQILEDNREGTTVQSVKTETLQKFVLNVPPLAEQRRIVAKVEQILARVNAARERLGRVPATLKRFRQSVLAAACSGRLTVDWRVENPSVEPTSTVLHQLASERSSSEPVSVADELLPDKWASTNLGFLTEPGLRGRPFVTSGSRGWADYVGSEGVHFIRSENINTEQLRLDDAVRVNPPPGAEADRTKVRPGDLLLTITGNNVGRTAVVPKDCPVAHVSQHVAIIRIDRRCDTNYLWLWVRSEKYGQKQLGEAFYGGTKPGLNLDQVKNMAVYSISEK